MQACLTHPTTFELDLLMFSIYLLFLRLQSGLFQAIENRDKRLPKLIANVSLYIRLLLLFMLKTYADLSLNDLY